MKHKILGVIAFAAIAVTAGFNYQQNKQKAELSDIVIANIEALANGESSGSSCRWSRVKDQYGCTYWNCVSNGDGDPCNCGDTKG